MNGPGFQFGEDVGDGPLEPDFVPDCICPGEECCGCEGIVNTCHCQLPDESEEE